MSDAERTVEETGLSAEELSALSERFAAIAPLLGAIGGLFPQRESGESDAEREMPPAREEAPPDGTLPVGALPVGGGDGWRERGGRPDAFRGKHHSHREQLLRALRPYLSPAGRESADYLLRLCRLYEAVRCLL